MSDLIISFNIPESIEQKRLVVEFYQAIHHERGVGKREQSQRDCVIAQSFVLWQRHKEENNSQQEQHCRQHVI